MADFDYKAAYPEPLYPKGARIPIIVTTGELSAGKTLFALTLDPYVRNDGQPAPTKVWDFEGSAEPYQGGLNFEWVDSSANVKDYAVKAVFEWWQEQLLAVPKNRYRVLVVDTMDDILKGSVEWVRERPKMFGCTPNEFEKASSMFLWPAVKSYWKKVIFVEARKRCETLVMNFHLKNEWKDKRPTGRRIPEGYDVMFKLATLYLRLDRTPKAKTKRAPTVPRGIVIKERLVMFGATADDDRPILPPQLPKATGDQIRKYIIKPPNYDNLSVDERHPDESMSDDDRLIIKAGIAEAQATTATAQLGHVEAMKVAAAEQAAAMGQEAPPQDPETTTTLLRPGVTMRMPKSYSAKTTDACGPDHVEEIRKLLGEVDASLEDGQAMLTKRGVKCIADLSLVQAEELITKLRAFSLERQIENPH